LRIAVLQLRGRIFCRFDRINDIRRRPRMPGSVKKEPPLDGRSGESEVGDAEVGDAAAGGAAAGGAKSVAPRPVGRGR
jgi:hypothetical protein